MKIDHISIWTNQIEKMRSYYVIFYEGAGQNPLVDEESNTVSVVVSYLNGSNIKLIQVPQLEKLAAVGPLFPYLGRMQITFQTAKRKDVDIKAFSLAGSSHKVVNKPFERPDGMYAFETLDPDGNTVLVGTYAKE